MYDPERFERAHGHRSNDWLARDLGIASSAALKHRDGRMWSWLRRRGAGADSAPVEAPVADVAPVEIAVAKAPQERRAA